MTECSNEINYSWTLRNILVVGNNKSLELIAKRIETDHWKYSEK